MAHQALEDWVQEVAQITTPDSIHWCDGSESEINTLYELMVSDGTLTMLDGNKHPNSYLARSDINDVARVEGRTFICSGKKEDAGPTNNWMAPAEMHAVIDPLFEECMQGRVMYVIPYLMGPAGSAMSKVGIEITDSPYVVANMRIMTRMGQIALDELGEDGEFVKGLHSTGQLDPEQRYISHFPDENLIMSFSSNYGGNALLGKKCFALRLASVLGKREGWMAEHMLILGITSPEGKKSHICAAFPSACGKTNLAMLVPPQEFLDAGWKVETVGDDIAWLKFGPDGRLYAINPEFGFFGVAPGTSMETNPNALLSCRSNTLFTNVALCPDNTIWWEGLTEEPPASAIDWKGNPWTPESGDKAAHPNSRFTAPAAQCPSISDDFENSAGVPIDAIVFGGRRSTTTPLVYESFNWQHGTYLGATMTSEKTAAAAGKVGELRHDPMAMLPFCGYHMADYWQHWLDMGKRGGEKMPRVFHVNWFRKDSEGKFVWPGFGDNMHVLKWIVERCEGKGEAHETPIGYLPDPATMQIDNLGLDPNDVELLFSVDAEEWQEEVEAQTDYFKMFGEKLPEGIRAELEALKSRL
ncbi:MAG: phosphoenolpyruvate carboxykinase (GTP) [Planctomycetaceae bacterium]|jgi:phosphoenolpyruvate carboxykinase (GTP)|nr:phosphoenolpyruvate carboxykinase (GTP) [Planctomycetaceae bacterium]MDC0273247.1 phosphoenolpyruvate carboxykinase (GTP) [Planctomycetaceae bacterium]MDG2387942.1 phosphoenolpyruvate carboxykinase (GTP) [Planctomycetaceae bacterium]